MKTQEFYCNGCNQDVVREVEDNCCTTGYAYLFNPYTEEYDQKLCFECCAERDMNSMIKTGNSKSLPLYHTKGGDGQWLVTNWSGTLRFSVKVQWKGNHNWGFVGDVTFFRFVGPDNAIWSGKQIGGNNNIAHCKRTKLMDISA